MQENFSIERNKSNTIKQGIILLILWWIYLYCAFFLMVISGMSLDSWESLSIVTILFLFAINWVPLLIMILITLSIFKKTTNKKILASFLILPLLIWSIIIISSTIINMAYKNNSSNWIYKNITPAKGM